MTSLHHSSPIALITAVVAGSMIMFQHSGFFDGAFHSEILASVKAEDAITAADWAAMNRGFAVDQRTTASLH